MADGLPFSLDSLLNNPQFDFVTQFHQGNPLNEDDFFNFVDANDSPYDGLNMSSSYLDETELILSKKNCTDLSFYSLNIQSLPAKFTEFCEHICVLSASNCSPDIICLQETWRIVDPTIFLYQDIASCRSSRVTTNKVEGLVFTSKMKFNSEF